MQRAELCRIVRTLGVQGAPALEHAARQAVWLCGLGTYVPPRKALKEREREYVERRVREELVALKDARRLFPRLQKNLDA